MSWLPPPHPEHHSRGPLTFVPLRPEMVRADFAAVMRNPSMLRRWSASDWPADDFTEADNLEDLVWHDREQREGIALTYSLLVDDVVQGCLYVRPVADALSTRDLEMPDPSPFGPHDVAARAWAHDLTAAALLPACADFLSTFAFPRLWWQANTDCPEQLTACDGLGWSEAVTVVGSVATWVLRSVPE